MILVDEPTGNLDASTTGRVMELLHKCHNAGSTIIIATHDDSIYRHTTNRVLELKHGEIHSLTGGGPL